MRFRSWGTGSRLTASTGMSSPSYPVSRTSRPRACRGFAETAAARLGIHGSNVADFIAAMEAETLSRAGLYGV